MLWFAGAVGIATGCFIICMAGEALAFAEFREWDVFPKWWRGMEAGFLALTAVGWPVLMAHP